MVTLTNKMEGKEMRKVEKNWEVIEAVVQSFYANVRMQIAIYPGTNEEKWNYFGFSEENATKFIAKRFFRVYSYSF